MSGRLWVELVGLLVRYLVSALVGALVSNHYIDEHQGSEITTLLTDPELVLGIATLLASLAFGVRSWLKSRREVLTASALSATPPAMVALLAKQEAPSLASPRNKVPQLRVRA